jgi:hypothetical protein
MKPATEADLQPWLDRLLPHNPTMVSGHMFEFRMHRLLSGTTAVVPQLAGVLTMIMNNFDMDALHELTRDGPQTQIFSSVFLVVDVHNTQDRCAISVTHMFVARASLPKLMLPCAPFFPSRRTPRQVCLR